MFSGRLLQLTRSRTTFLVAKNVAGSLSPMIPSSSIVFSQRAYNSSLAKGASASGPLVSFKKSEVSDNVAIITMHRASFNMATAKEFIAQWEEMERDPTTRAAVLTSDHKSIFCAGIDFNQFAEGNFQEFWVVCRRLFEVIYSSRLNTSAAMQGHALGLGCVIAMACNDRFAVQDPRLKIGLNEVAVGIHVPQWLCELFGRITSARHAERLLPLGRSLSVQQAMQINLIDKEFKDRQEMDEFVVRYLDGRCQVSKMAQEKTLGLLKKNFLENEFRAKAEEDVQSFVDTVTSDEAQAMLKGALEALKKPKA